MLAVNRIMLLLERCHLFFNLEKIPMQKNSQSAATIFLVCPLIEKEDCIFLH